ncbi:MAG TPA: acyl-CoA dehydrogenase family protein [Steroidobacteraceae bacterium]|nr:acyl-CoA dehydrogenase family protein [Steroidobacteraceae bacterium]
MQFEFNEEQLALQESVRRFLTERYDFETRRNSLAKPTGSSDEIWQAFAEQGFLSIGLPEAHGGIGGATELMLTMEEIGRALVLEPYLSTVALCAPLIADHGTDSQQADLLPRVAAGGLKLALAHGEAEARYASTVRTEARRAGDSYVLNGAKATVPDGAVADLLLVSARMKDGAGKDLAVFLVDPNAPGVRLVRYRTQDGRSAADVFFDDVKLPAGEKMLGVGDATAAIERAVQRGIAALCAEAVGAMEAANATTIEYTKSRKQFGQPIGRFQALQHRMADMYVQATQARSMSILATGRCAAQGMEKGDEALRRRDVSAAKCYVGKAARFVGQQAVQLHGGMGMADELAVSHYFKRLTMIDMTFGDSTHHLAVVSDSILLESHT